MSNKHGDKDEFETCSKAEDYSVKLIFEFLSSQGLHKTSKLLQEEIVSFDLNFPQEITPNKERIHKKDVLFLLKILETTDHISFFKNWDCLVPQSIQELSDYKKLTIYLYTYYATLPFRSDFKYIKKNENFEILDQKEDKINLNGTFIIEKPTCDDVPNIDSISIDDKFETDSLEEDFDAMKMFKIFLLQHGAELSDEPEFLPYFALPFVENPKNHPTFIKIFEDDWVYDLKSNFKQFLYKYSCGDSVVPELVKMCKNKDETNNNNMSKEYKDVKRKMHKLKRDHQKLVGVASELASALEKSVQGEAVDLKSTLLSCISIFPDLFPMHNLEPNQWNHSQSGFLPKRQILHSHLDAYKIKKDLYNGSVKTQLLLLQALRWHLMRNDPEERELFVQWLTRHDVLGLSGEISEFLSPTSHPLQQSILRLLNAISSINCGRDYISSSKVVNLLIQIAKCPLDQISDNMIVAIIQKLSLRKNICEIMIEKGLIDHFLNKLKIKNYNKYSFEYLTSLLMNLAMHAQIKYWDKHTDISGFLIDLLVNSENGAKEFLTGILCCVLRNEFVNKQCIKESLGLKISKFNNKNHEPTLSKQLDTLIKLHRREISPFSFCLDQNCDDELEDPDELDAEIDENDMVKGSIYGDEFLEQYCLIFPNPGIVGRSYKSNIINSNSSSVKLPRWATEKF